jgi:hypothetical protein
VIIFGSDDVETVGKEGERDRDRKRECGLEERRVMITVLMWILWKLFDVCLREERERRGGRIEKRGIYKEEVR